MMLVSPANALPHARRQSDSGDDGTGSDDGGTSSSGGDSGSNGTDEVCKLFTLRLRRCALILTTVLQTGGCSGTGQKCDPK